MGTEEPESLGGGVGWEVVTRERALWAVRLGKGAAGQRAE